MTGRGEDGYILASALAVLVAISLVAAALVSTSADGLRRVRSAEADAAEEMVLRSSLLLAVSQLALDPRRRQVQFDDGGATVGVLGQQVQLHVVWESAKVDVNFASMEDIDERLGDAGVALDTRSAVRSAIESGRAKEQPIKWLDDVIPAPAERDCLHSVLTVFGGRPEYDADGPAIDVRVGRPAAGARLSVEAWLAGEATRGLAAVVLMTGDPAEPAKVLDWRDVRTIGEERCDDR